MDALELHWLSWQRCTSIVAMFKIFPAVATAIALAMWAPVAADAAVVTVEDGTLVFRALAGEQNVPALYPGSSGGIAIDDLGGASIRISGANCVPAGSGVQCGVPERLLLELGDGEDRVDWATTFPSSVDVEIRGGAGADRLKANEFRPNAVILDGGEGDDLLDGFAQSDVLRGGSGNDTLNGLGGDDVLEGGDGDDRLRPDSGSAVMGRDVIDGGAGFDVVDDWTNPAATVHPPVTVTADGVANDGRPGENDNLLGVEGVLSGVSGSFTMSDGDNEVIVSAHLDERASTVDGRAGSDWLEGGSAQETLLGGPGDDRLEGGFNHDTLTGGPGRDVIFGDRTSAQCGGYGQSCTAPFGDDTIDARDGEADEVDCGVGTDSAVLDAIDTHSNCEHVDLTVPAVAEPVPPTEARGDAPRPAAAASIVVKRVRLGAALRRGIEVAVAGLPSGRSKVTLKRGRDVVAAATLIVGANGRGRTTLRFTRRAARSFRGRRSITLTLGIGRTTRAVRLRR